MKWEDRITELLAQRSINQTEYNEFLEIGNKLTSDSDLEKYQQFGEGIYLLLEPNVKTEDF
jgi:hypothetical protein|tara:strand:- start:120 stop:302 length:183 start_codon:yes stop_codon:yes gene_type:complete